jgi:endonuclease/exonuclease/phosphatase family metal-dependent hydrolase
VALVLSWNVAGRVGAVLEAQIAALAGCDADVLCLQEVTPTTHARWRAALQERGLHVEVSAFPPGARGSRRLATLIAGRSPLTLLPSPPLPWPERHLACLTLLDSVEVEVRNVHAPLSQKAEQVKVRTLEAVFEAVNAPGAHRPCILTGDLNTPQYESREGEIQTFARTRTGRVRPAYGERHDQAELLLVAELPRRGWSDAFRALHGYGRRDRSWVPLWRGPGYRLDHILLSPGIRPVACEYVHEWREQRLSDHSAIWAEIDATPSRD